MPRLRATVHVQARCTSLPVVVPSPGEYVARGAAVQAVWASTGERPQRDVALASTPEPDFQPLISQNYKSASGRVDSGN